MKPKISFKGFKEPWEVSTLSNFFSKVNEKNARMLYSAVLTNSAEYGIIDQRDYFDFDVANSNNISGYYIVQPDDFVYNPRVSVTAPVGPINKNELGYIGVMSPLYLVFKINGINKDYLCHYFKSNKWHKFMRISGNCGARFDRLSISDEQFVQMPIPYPINSKEQQTICNYLEKIDKLISTASSRLASLKQVKEASLQAMFPQKGETVPKIRFKGFEGEWTKVKLNDICFKKASNLSESSLGIDTGQYAVYGASGYLQNISTFDIPSEYVGIIKDGSGVGRTKVYPAFTSILGTMQYILAKEDNNIRFIAALFENIDFSTFISGSGIPHIYFRDYGEIYVMIPSLVEQQAIASYFTSLDKQIALQTQQLEKLRQIKAACLDKMFV